MAGVAKAKHKGTVHRMSKLNIWVDFHIIEHFIRHPRPEYRRFSLRKTCLNRVRRMVQDEISEHTHGMGRMHVEIRIADHEIAI
mmetsp:Transcript_12325/g.38003  ORF Transcript_12325/g.38003 Transcript_12325/m.38003 type:complete len:84 (-) Transcript_12325:1514-1765(-)